MKAHECSTGRANNQGLVAGAKHRTRGVAASGSAAAVTPDATARVEAAEVLLEVTQESVAILLERFSRQLSREIRALQDDLDLLRERKQLVYFRNLPKSRGPSFGSSSPRGSPGKWAMLSSELDLGAGEAADVFLDFNPMVSWPSFRNSSPGSPRRRGGELPRTSWTFCACQSSSGKSKSYPRDSWPSVWAALHAVVQGKARLFDAWAFLRVSKQRTYFGVAAAAGEKAVRIHGI